MVYRLPAIAAILFYWITMKVVQQLTCLTLGRPNGPAYSIGELLNTPMVCGRCGTDPSTAASSNRCGSESVNRSVRSPQVSAVAKRWWTVRRCGCSVNRCTNREGGGRGGTSGLWWRHSVVDQLDAFLLLSVCAGLDSTVPGRRPSVRSGPLVRLSLNRSCRLLWSCLNRRHHGPVQTFRRTLLRYVRLMAWAVCLSSVCDVVAPSSEIWTFRKYFCTV